MSQIIKVLMIVFIILSLNLTNTYADNNIDLKTKQLFNKLNKSVVKKHKSDKGLKYYKKIVSKFDLITEKKKLNNKQSKLISDLTKLINEKIFTLEFAKLEYSPKITLKTNSLLKDFKHFYTPDGIIKENGFWYGYTYEDMYFFKSINSINKATLDHNGLNKNNSIVFIKNGNPHFIKNYKKFKIAKEGQLYGVPGKYEILKFLKNNKIHLGIENYSTLDLIKSKTEEIITGKTSKQEKIDSIYAYVLDNITYTNNFKLTDYRIFDGLETFKNKDGVCEGYVEIFKIMLAYADIESQIITGDVLNAADFPDIGHAWVKIGKHYYDPTFDDPLGANQTKKPNEYKYYKLPTDLFYTNRYNDGELPESYKTLSLEKREEIIWNNLYKIASKYKNNNYVLLEAFKFRVKYNLNKKDLTINDFKKIIETRNVGKDFGVKINGKMKFIKKLNYITVNDKNIEQAYANKFNYDSNGLYLFNWELENGTKVNRLGFNVEFVD